LHSNPSPFKGEGGVRVRLFLALNSRWCQMKLDVAGFRPGSRPTFVSAKVGKTMLAVAWSFGCPPRFADSGGGQTRGAWPESCRRAQTVPAFSPVSAALLGHATRPGSKGRLIIVQWNESRTSNRKRTNSRSLS